MSRFKDLFYLFIIIFSVLFAAGCSTAIPAFIVGLVKSPIGTPTPSKTYTPTITLTETLTLTVTPTQTSTYTETSTPEISQDLAHPENLPKITLEDATSTKFAQDFLVAAAAGKLPKAPPTAKPWPVIVDYNSSESMIAHYGLTGMFVLDSKKAYEAGVNISDLKERPNYVAAAYQVTEGGETAYLVIMGYVNGGSNPDGYWGFLFRPESSLDVAQELQSYFPGDDLTSVTDGEYLANEKGVRAYLGDFGNNSDSAFGTWYLNMLKKDPELVFPKQILEKWQRGKVLTNVINGTVAIPITFTGTTTTIAQP